MLSATILDQSNLTQKYICKLPRTRNGFGVIKCMVEMDVKNYFRVETGMVKRA